MKCAIREYFLFCLKHLEMAIVANPVPIIKVDSNHVVLGRRLFNRRREKSRPMGIFLQAY